VEGCQHWRSHVISYGNTGSRREKGHLSLELRKHLSGSDKGSPEKGGMRRGAKILENRRYGRGLIA